VLFAYNRPEHVRQTVEALAQNALAARTDLWVFSDGPKDDGDAGRVGAVRTYLRTISGFHSVAITERPENFGLARSIVAGVTEVVNARGRAIVVEDDIVTTPGFLTYMNDALDRYADEETVVSVSGYFYPVAGPVPETFFLRGADCWGWATWCRGWNLFEPDGAKLLAELRERRLERAFDYNGAYPYTQMLVDQIAGKNDSWAIKWHASAFLRGRLTLYPGTSLVQNIGNDGSGTHGVNVNDPRAAVDALAHVEVGAIPIVEDEDARRNVESYFRSQNPLGRLMRRWSAWRRHS